MENLADFIATLFVYLFILAVAGGIAMFLWMFFYLIRRK